MSCPYPVSSQDVLHSCPNCSPSQDGGSKPGSKEVSKGNSKGNRKGGSKGDNDEVRNKKMFTFTEMSELDEILDEIEQVSIIFRASNCL